MIYVASSWRNSVQPIIVRTLRDVGHDVYDFRHPRDGDDGFHWSEIDPDWERWDPGTFRNALGHPIAIRGFDTDKAALDAATAGLLVMPSGRSAHLELGYLIGRGVPTAILAFDGEPELMYALADEVLISKREVVRWAERLKKVTA